MIGKGIAKLGTLAKKYGRFPKAAEFKSSYANVKTMASSAKTKAVKFGSQAKEKLYKANSAVSKHIAKNPKKYAAGAIGLAGAGVYSQHQKLKKDGTHAKLKKALQAKGYVD